MDQLWTTWYVCSKTVAPKTKKGRSMEVDLSSALIGSLFVFFASASQHKAEDAHKFEAKLGEAAVQQKVEEQAGEEQGCREAEEGGSNGR
jgi:hypothetical protein